MGGFILSTTLGSRRERDLVSLMDGGITYVPRCGNGHRYVRSDLEAVINFVPVRSTSAEVEVFSVSMCGWDRVRSAMGIRAM